MAVDSECDHGDLPEYWKTRLGQVTTVRAHISLHVCSAEQCKNERQ
jgi:hypothetical protein